MIVLQPHYKLIKNFPLNTFITIFFRYNENTGYIISQPWSTIFLVHCILQTPCSDSRIFTWQTFHYSSGLWVCLSKIMIVHVWLLSTCVSLTVRGGLVAVLILLIFCVSKAFIFLVCICLSNVHFLCFFGNRFSLCVTRTLTPFLFTAALYLLCLQSVFFVSTCGLFLSVFHCINTTLYINKAFLNFLGLHFYVCMYVYGGDIWL